MTINFSVAAQTIRRVYATEKPAGDSVGYLRAAFDFSPDWDGLVRTAIFTTPDNASFAVALAGDTCIVPHEVIKPPCVHVSVRGDNALGELVRVPTVSYRLPITEPGATDGDTPRPPTPDEYAIIIGLMQTQAIDATRAETAQEKAEQSRDTAKGHAEQTALDRAATGADRTATGEDRTAVNTALLGFAETTLPAAIDSVENKADSEIIRVGQAGDEQVLAVETAGAEQIGLATAQADRAEGEADKSTSQASKSESYAVGGTGTRPGEDEDNSKHYSEVAQSASESAATSAGAALSAKRAAETAQGITETARDEAKEYAESIYLWQKAPTLATMDFAIMLYPPLLASI